MLKERSNFCRSLDIPLIKWEVGFELSCTKDRLLKHYNSIREVNFMITSTKLYVPVVTLSINDNIKFLENKKECLKEYFVGINRDLK